MHGSRHRTSHGSEPRLLAREATTFARRSNASTRQIMRKLERDHEREEHRRSMRSLPTDLIGAHSVSEASSKGRLSEMDA